MKQKQIPCGNDNQTASRDDSVFEVGLAALADDLFVEGGVLEGGLGPGEVLGHAAALEGGPGFGVVEDGEGAAEGVEEVGGGLGLELEAGAGEGRVEDGVVEASGGVDDGDGSVAEAVHLVEAAGFRAGGHEEDVGAGFDFVSHDGAEAVDDADFFGVFAGEAVEEALVEGLAGAENDKKDVFLHEFGEGFGEEVEAFLRGKAGDHAEDGGGVGDGFEGASVEEVAAALAFALEVFGGEVGGDVRVGGGVPLGVVGAVEDAGEVGAALLEDGFEAEAERGGLDFCGVFPADGGEGVGVADAALEEVDLPVEFEAVGGVGFGREEEGLDG